ncbi:MAG: peptide chain release factor N(5)-glutamine methyltransferase [Bacillota bacterium]|nr:peptide chain release factor N(5)-glutamine methyltransferase [Bacillota bacterium]
MPRAHTCSELLAEGTARLREAGVDRPRFEAELLLGHVAGLRREKLLLSAQKPVPAAWQAGFLRAVTRRAGGEPYAYVVGHKEFMSLDLLVSPHVLIPRPETELLVELGLRFLRESWFLEGSPSDPRGPLAIDVGTGSGAVALALAHGLPGLRVLALDVSEAAAAVAARNAARLGLADRVTVLVSDLLTSPELPPPGTADLVLANLPYVPAGVFGKLAPGVASFEPRLALDGGPDGLSLIRRLVPQAADIIRPGGACALECGPEQCTLLAGLLSRSGFAGIQVHRDLAGRARVVWGIRDGQGHQGTGGRG